jgi:hypothetical protein
VFRPLVEVHVPVEQQAARERTSVKDLPFYGLWKDRADIKDGLDFVNKLRDNPRG